MDTSTTAPTTTRRARRSLADDIVNLKGELQAAHAAHAGKVAELEKKLASAESMQKHYAEGARKAESELEQIASLCDALDGAHAGKVAELEKKLASAESMQKHYAEGARKAESELEQIASLCDALDGAPPRRKEVTNQYGRSETVELSALTRLSAYLAQRK